MTDEEAILSTELLGQYLINIHDAIAAHGWRSVEVLDRVQNMNSYWQDFYRILAHLDEW